MKHLATFFLANILALTGLLTGTPALASAPAAAAKSAPQATPRPTASPAPNKATRSSNRTRTNQTRARGNAQLKSANNQLPTKLPAKKKSEPQRIFVDFSKDSDAVVLSPRQSLIRDALRSSDQDLAKAQGPTEVRSRTIFPAPPGDIAESAEAINTPLVRPQPTPRRVAQPRPQPPRPAATPTPIAVTAPSPSPSPTPAAPIEVLASTSSPEPDKTHELVADLPTKATQSETPQVVVSQKALSESPLVESSSPKPIEASLADLAESPASLSTSPAPPSSSPAKPSTAVEREEGGTLAFLRGGYLAARYKKFDDRMKNGATSIGVGVARSFETAWGSFEARAAADIYHAMDQSVTVDNIRMFSTRTELAYWFSRSRVKPGISLGLGWADYSVRSYRSVSGVSQSSIESDQESGRTIVIRTHAKSQAFTVIPGTALRVELGKGLVIDAQTEFIALLGGDSADAVQGLGATISLGWIF